MEEDELPPDLEGVIKAVAHKFLPEPEEKRK